MPTIYSKFFVKKENDAKGQFKKILIAPSILNKICLSNNLNCYINKKNKLVIKKLNKTILVFNKKVIYFC